jgi:hypothetical protein
MYIGGTMMLAANTKPINPKANVAALFVHPPGQQAQQQQQGAFSSSWRREPLTLFPDGKISAGSFFLQHPMMISLGSSYFLKFPTGVIFLFYSIKRY